MNVSNLKIISSKMLHGYLGVAQKPPWIMECKLRKAVVSVSIEFEGLVKVDEAHKGGKERPVREKETKRRAGRRTQDGGS